MFKIFKRNKLTNQEVYAIGYNLGKNTIDTSVFDEMRRKKQNIQIDTKVNNKES